MFMVVTGQVAGKLFSLSREAAGHYNFCSDWSALGDLSHDVSKTGIEFQP